MEMKNLQAVRSETLFHFLYVFALPMASKCRHVWYRQCLQADIDEAMSIWIGFSMLKKYIRDQNSMSVLRPQVFPWTTTEETTSLGAVMCIYILHLVKGLWTGDPAACVCVTLPLSAWVRKLSKKPESLFLPPFHLIRKSQACFPNLFFILYLGWWKLPAFQVLRGSSPSGIATRT